MCIAWHSCKKNKDCDCIPEQFTYENIVISPNFRIIPAIKKRSDIKMERIQEKLEKLCPNVMLFDRRYAKQIESLLDSFHKK